MMPAGDFEHPVAYGIRDIQIADGVSCHSSDVPQLGTRGRTAIALKDHHIAASNSGNDALGVAR